MALAANSDEPSIQPSPISRGAEEGGLQELNSQLKSNGVPSNGV